MDENIKKTFVVDASFVLAFLMPDENNFEVDQLFNQFKASFVHFIASPILPFEIVNGLKTALLRNRITKNYCLDRIEEFLNYQIQFQEVNYKEVFLVAEKYNLSGYDASYVWLSQKENLPLLTLDRKMQKLTK